MYTPKQVALRTLAMLLVIGAIGWLLYAAAGPKPLIGLVCWFLASVLLYSGAYYFFLRDLPKDP